MVAGYFSTTQNMNEEQILEQLKSLAESPYFKRMMRRETFGQNRGFLMLQAYENIVAAKALAEAHIAQKPAKS